MSLVYSGHASTLSFLYLPCLGLFTNTRRQSVSRSEVDFGSQDTVCRFEFVSSVQVPVCVLSLWLRQTGLLPLLYTIQKGFGKTIIYS